jgi:hypothetical protein
VLVFEQDHALYGGAVGFGEPQWRLDARRRRRLFAAHDLRHADLRTGLEAFVALGAPAVDAHLPGPQQLLQVGIPDVRKVYAEPPVEAHVRFGGLHSYGLDAVVHRAL